MIIVITIRNMIYVYEKCFRKYVTYSKYNIEIDKDREKICSENHTNKLVSQDFKSERLKSLLLRRMLQRRNTYYSVSICVRCLAYSIDPLHCIFVDIVD